MNQYQRTCPTPTCFRRWANKTYAVFSSLHRHVKIGVLCAAYTILVWPSRCFAQVDTLQLNRIELDELEVSAEAAPNVFTPVGRTVTQVRKADLERAAAQNLADMLEFIPGIDMRQRGPHGTQTDVSIRGASFDQTLVLLNGINISDPQTGHYSLNLPIDIESIEKIEVLEGPAARIFGNNALGGAVNFITGTHNKNTLTASIAAGQYGFYKTALTATKHTRNTANHLSISHTASDGYMHNTAFKTTNVFAQSKWNNRLVPLDFQLGYTQKDLGANSFYGPKYPDQYESLHTFFAALKGDAAVRKVHISPTAYWRRNYDRYILNRHNPDVYQNFHLTDVYGIDIIAAFSGRFGRSSAGILTRGEHIFSNNLGKSSTKPHPVPRHEGRFYDKNDKRTGISAFAEQNLYIGKWSASAGILANLNSYTGNKVHFYPGIDIGFHPNNIIKIYASANRAMRLPTFTDLYYQSPVNIGNTDLKPEHSTEYELGTKLARGSWNAHIGYFYRIISDAIDWIWLDEQQKWHTMNLTILRTHGISAGGRWDVQQKAGNSFPIQSLAAYYTFMNSSKSASNLQSYYALDYLRHKLSISLTHRIAEKVNAHWQAGWQHRNGTYLHYRHDDGTETAMPYEPFWQIDLRIYRKTERLNMYVEATNLGNRKHQDIGNVILPGRWIRAGIGITIEQNRD